MQLETEHAKIDSSASQSSDKQERIINIELENINETPQKSVTKQIKKRSQTKTEPTESSPPQSVPTKHDSFFGATFNLANSTIGSGILGLSFVLYETGIILGIFFIALGGLFSHASILMLQQASTNVLEIDETKRDYEDIGEYCYGKFVSFLIKVSVVFLNFGSSCSYLIILGDLMLPIFKLVVGETNSIFEGYQARFIVTLLFIIPLVIISSVKKIADMRIFSYLSLAAVFSFGGFVFVEFITGATNDIKSGKVELWKNEIKMFRVLGIIIFAFSCHTNVCPINSEFKKENKYKVKRAIHTNVVLCFILYACTASFGYLSFLDNTPRNLILGYKQTVLNMIFQIVFGVSVFFTYPLVSYPCRLSLDNLIMDFYNAIMYCWRKAKISRSKFKKLDSTNEGDLELQEEPSIRNQKEQAPVEIPKELKTKQQEESDKKSTKQQESQDSPQHDNPTHQNPPTHQDIPTHQEPIVYDQPNSKRKKWLEYLRTLSESTLIGGGAFIIAVFFGRIEVVLSLTGSTASALTSFTFPGLLYVKLSKHKRWNWKNMVAIFVSVTGTLFGAFVTAVEIYDLVTGESKL